MVEYEASEEYVCDVCSEEPAMTVSEAGVVLCKTCAKDHRE